MLDFLIFNQLNFFFSVFRVKSSKEELRGGKACQVKSHKFDFLLLCVLSSLLCIVCILASNNEYN